MAKLTIDDLKKIKEETAKSTSIRDGEANIKITVHMGTCGIAAGARAVMNALMEEMAEKPNRSFIKKWIRTECARCSNGMFSLAKFNPILPWRRCSIRVQRFWVPRSKLPCGNIFNFPRPQN